MGSFVMARTWLHGSDRGCLQGKGPPGPTKGGERWYLIESIALCWPMKRDVGGAAGDPPESTRTAARSAGDERVFSSHNTSAHTPANTATHKDANPPKPSHTDPNEYQSGKALLPHVPRPGVRFPASADPGKPHPHTGILQKVMSACVTILLAWYRCR